MNFDPFITSQISVLSLRMFLVVKRKDERKVSRQHGYKYKPHISLYLTELHLVFVEFNKQLARNKFFLFFEILI